MNKDIIRNEIMKLIEKYYEIPTPSDKNRVTLSTSFYDSKEIKRAVSTLLSGWISQGKNVKEFENLFSKIIGCKYGIATNSGSSANLIALNAIKNIYSLNDGDQVIVPAATFATVSMPIVQLGLIPVYVDVRRDTLNIDALEIETAINKKTKIIMPVHTLGLSSDMSKIMQIADDHNLIVFEDCCEAHGSSINDKNAGSWGLVSAFSFFVAHNITTGEGGMILTNDDIVDKECRSLREFGRYQKNKNDKGMYYTDDLLKDYDKRYVFSNIGYNLRMTDICAALGIEQTKKLDDLNSKRINNANYLRKAFEDNFSKYFELPKINQNYKHTYYTFSFTLKEDCPFNRKQLCDVLEKNNIETRPMMGGSLPDQPAFRDQPGIVHGKLENSRYIRDNTMFVGIHPGLEKQHLDYIINNIINFINKI